jgi:phenylacetate-CoA ligase
MKISDSLQNIISHAYTTTKLYTDLINGEDFDFTQIHSYEDFQRLPIVTKTMIQANPDAAISKSYQKFPLNSRLGIQRTSGSTGQYMRVYWHEDDAKRSLTELWLLRMKRFDIKPTDKNCFFYTTDYAANKIIEEKDEVNNPLLHSIGFCKSNVSEEKWKSICIKIATFQPKWMILQPSTAMLLGEKFRANGISIPASLKYIELTGEYLFEHTRREIENMFKCNIGNQYGCNEANSIAFECQEKTMHIMASNVFVEVLKDGKPVEYGEVGDIHITSLTNYAMPFIRYAIGDRGRLLRNECSCGYRNDCFEIISGRVNEFVITKDGNRILPYTFLRPIENINERIGNIIRQFQIVQENYDRFCVKLVIKPSYSGWKESIHDMFLRYLNEPLLHNVSWDFQFSEEPLVNPEKDKLAYFFSRIAH